jgi:hypothetical protein
VITSAAVATTPVRVVVEQGGSGWLAATFAVAVLAAGATAAAAYFAWRSSSAASRSAGIAVRSMAAEQFRHEQDRWQGYAQALALYTEALRDLEHTRASLLTGAGAQTQELVDRRAEAVAARARARGALPAEVSRDKDDVKVLAKRIHAPLPDSEEGRVKDPTAVTSTEVEVLHQEAREQLRIMRWSSRRLLAEDNAPAGKTADRAATPEKA